MSSALTAKAAGDVASKSETLRQIEIVDAPADISPEQRAQLDALLDDLRLAFTWCTNITWAMVDRKLASSQLPNDPQKVEEYSVKVIEDVLSRRAGNWLSATVNSDVKSVVDRKFSDFNSRDLVTVLNQVRPQPPPAAKLEDAFTTFAEDIKKGVLEKGPVDRVYWILVAQVRFDKITGQFGAVLQRFNFHLEASQEDRSSGAFGAKTKHVKVTPCLVGTQWDFLDRHFANVRDAVKETIGSNARDLIKGPGTDTPVHHDG